LEKLVCILAKYYNKIFKKLQVDNKAWLTRGLRCAKSVQKWHTWHTCNPQGPMSGQAAPARPPARFN